MHQEPSFLINVNFYDQIDRILMGSRLGSVLAHLFIEHHEKKWVEANKVEVLLYRR